MGRNGGWKSQRSHRAALETIRTERSEINLGRRSCCYFARGPRKSKSTGDCAAYTRGTGEVARRAGRRASPHNGLNRRTVDRIAVDAFRKILPAECAQQTG